jgi:hypothetical protein
MIYTILTAFPSTKIARFNIFITSMTKLAISLPVNKIDEKRAYAGLIDVGPEII